MEINQNIIKTSGTSLAKHCEKCVLDITYKNWARHTMSKRHKINDPESTIQKKFIRKGPSVKELREHFIKKGFTGISKMCKKQLISELEKGSQNFKKRRVKLPVVFTKPRKINRIFPLHETLFPDIKKPREKPFAFFPVNVKINEKFKTIQLSYHIDLKKITEVENALYLMLLLARSE